ncbi:MAG: DNA polymerase III subunit chi [Alphaproteobacteria bacterium ADurb.Bin438]|nr:MAG: DNA polymerase III subunit chi [Alphaproteobacteria bacterium ADurb.Bin438]
MRIDFYHLTSSTLQKILPQLAINIDKTKKHAIFLFKDDNEVEKFNDYLWTFKDTSFIPHGSKNDGNENLQPIFLSSEFSNPNDAKFIVYTSPLNNINPEFERVFIIFNGNNKMELEMARNLWKKGIALSAEMHYWQDLPEGWVEKKL